MFSLSILTTMANITFVDDQDNVVGAGTREEAVEKGIPHRISRVFLTNTNGEVLIQKRSNSVASNPGKWDHSASGHVDEGESYEQAAYRELKEEIGVADVPLTEIGYYYQEETEDPRNRKRFNRVYRGTYDGEVRPDLEEVSQVKWIYKTDLDELIEKKPEDFTLGFVKAYRFVRKLL